MSEKKILPAEELDRLFDEGTEDMAPYLNTEKIRRPGRDARRVNVDFPAWMIEALDKEAEKIGITRQALIKTVIHSHLQSSQG